ncbi:hypothetical protein [Nodularia sphaerocarpa]|uniref:hypothetical protein n=1 Tax=Nodularia sphaerocarpa TaxID=137816 RepID=UPI001EFBB977|nr:hypothetical protein [Nodularia sphaerocarpa]MDB9374753.1 hypothetical protein [Nodularia sphaerocarpa CS-585]MDB9378347.1 hypothetical protein [Nodularia sphaerocarpa CS-585A2]ULP70591.1 hypothetical protein BDGGKGIB_00207 [Nodularia sphaerocarpa UHCC 0038]
MSTDFNNNNSSDHQLQPDILAFLSSLLALEDPIAFLNKCKEVLQLSRQSQKEKAEAEAEARRIAKAKLEEELCNQLVVKILRYVKSQGINPNDLPFLKSKSHDELRAYIEEFWPELIPHI